MQDDIFTAYKVRELVLMTAELVYANNFLTAS